MPKKLTIDTGFTGLENTLGGFYSDDVVTVKTGTDKEGSKFIRRFLTNIALNPRNTEPVLVVCLEQDEQEFTRQLLEEAVKENEAESQEGIEKIEKLFHSSIMISGMRPMADIVHELDGILAKNWYSMVIIDGAYDRLPKNPPFLHSKLFVQHLQALAKKNDTFFLLTDNISSDNCHDFEEDADKVLKVAFSIGDKISFRVAKNNAGGAGQYLGSQIADVIEPKKGTRGTELIAKERLRQINEEGWSPEHDSTLVKGELANAGACYAFTPEANKNHLHHLKGSLSEANPVPAAWPFAPGAWKPTPADRVRQLTKAGAFIAAEIDRLLEQEENNKA